MACDYKPALMKHRVTLQACTKATDSQGGYTETWADEVTVWAQITPMKAYERMQAQQLADPRSHKVLIRYRSGVTAAKRFLFGSRVLNIKEVINPEEANVYLQLICTEA